MPSKFIILPQNKSHLMMHVFRLRTFEHYVKQWQAEDPSYGALALPPAIAADADSEEHNPTLSNCQVSSSRQPMLPIMTNPHQNAPREACSWGQTQHVNDNTISDVNHDYRPSFDQRSASSVADHLQPTVFDHNTTGDADRPNFEEPSLDPMPSQIPRLMGESTQEQPAFDNFPGSYSNTTQYSFSYSGFEFIDWDDEDLFMKPNSGTLYTLCMKLRLIIKRCLAIHPATLI
jgi:hypothetical protein